MENEIRQNTDWLKALADDASLWEERAFKEMPAVIAHEYWRLHDLAKDGNVYGTMLQIKDVYEIILKYPCVLGLCIFRRTKDSAGAEAFDTLMSAILEKLLSFGDWRGTIAKSLIDFKEHLPTHLVRILEKTFTLVNENFVGKEADGETGIDVVNWRNDVIGHGALRLVEDDALKREICSMLKKLKEYFGTGSKISIHGQYDNIVLMQSGNTLVGWQTADLKGDTSPFSLVIKNGEAFSSPLEDIKYILPYENKICFFDTYMKYKQKSKYLDYVAGHLNIKSRDFFYDLYTKLVQDEKIKTMKESSTDVTDTETEKLLADLDRAVHFQKPRYIYDWMETKLNEDSKGCYMLRMGRGMGKSALSAYLDGRYNNTKKTPIHGNFVIRTHHCSRNQIRGINDFVTSLNTMFLEADHLSGYTKDIEGIFKDIKRDEKRNRAAATAELLNSYAKYFRQRKGKDIVLVVDGLDEIVDYGIFEYFPAPSSLEDGVYIFYTARPNEELSEELRRLIGGIDVLETRTVTGEDEDYKKLVRDYARDAVKNELEQRGVKDNRSEAYRELVETAGFNFLKLRVLIPIYCSGNGMEGNALASEADMFAHYLRLLNEQYGEKCFTLYVKPLLVNLAIFCDGLTLKELLNLMDDMDSSLMLYATLNDLRGVLSVERSERGNNYLFANEEYLRYIREMYAKEIVSAKRVYIEEIMDAAKAIRENFSWSEIGDALVDISSMDYVPHIREYIIRAFPKVFLLREKIFHISDIYKPCIDTGFPRQIQEGFIVGMTFGAFAVDSPRKLLGGNVTDVDFLYDFLLLSQSIGYDSGEFIRSVDILLWAQLFTYNLPIYSQQGAHFGEVCEKNAWCFAYLYRIFNKWEPLHAYLYSYVMDPNTDSNEVKGYFTGLSFYEMFKCHVQLILEKQIVTDSCQLFRILVVSNLLYSSDIGRLFFQYVMQRKELPLFVAHENEFFPIIINGICVQMIESICSESPGSDDWRTWISNVKLNEAINLCLESYSKNKCLYERIIAKGEQPRYISYAATQGERYRDFTYFQKIISFLQDNNRNKYLEMQFEELNEKPNENNDFLDILKTIEPATEDECQIIAALCLQKWEERKERLEKCLEDNIPFAEDVYAVADHHIISDYLTFACPDEDFDFGNAEKMSDFLSFAEDETARLASMSSNNKKLYLKFAYKYRWNPKKNLKKLKRWLDSHMVALFSSEPGLWIYFDEFHLYFNYMVKKDPDQLYDTLIQNQLWLRMWQQISPRFYENITISYKRIMHIRSMCYFMFCLCHATRENELTTAKALARQCIDNINKYRYCSGETFFAWIACQQLLHGYGKTAENSCTPVHYIQKRWLQFDGGNKRKDHFYIKMIDSYCALGICDLMLGDLALIPERIEQIDKLITEAEKCGKESRITYITKETKEDVYTHTAALNIIMQFLKGKVQAKDFRKEARILIHMFQKMNGEDNYGFCNHPVQEALLSMLFVLCKGCMSGRAYDKMTSSFDRVKEWKFSLMDNRFVLDFDYDSDFWEYRTHIGT